MKLIGIVNKLIIFSNKIGVDAIMILPDGKMPEELMNEVIIHLVASDTFCGSIIFTKLPQIYFL